MKEYPKGGLIGRTVHLIRHIQSLDVPLYAANAGFFMILSLFPALVLTLSLLRYTGLQVSSLVEVLSSILPEALMGGGNGCLVAARVLEELVDLMRSDIDKDSSGILTAPEPIGA